MELCIDAVLLVDFLSVALGVHSEVTVYDLSDADHPRLIVSKGALPEKGMDIAEAVKSVGEGQLHSKRHGNGGHCANLQSTILALKKASGEVTTLISVKTDMSVLQKARDALDALLADEPANSHSPDSVSVSELGDRILAEILTGYAVAPAHLSMLEKIGIIRDLDQQGLFRLRGFVCKVAMAFNISEPTIYRYLKRLRAVMP